MRYLARTIPVILCCVFFSVSAYAQYDYSTAVTLPLNGSASGTMDDSHKDYYWKVTTTADGSLYINTLSSSGLEIDNYLYDQDGKTRIASYDFGGSHPEDQVHFNNLTPGTYYINSNRFSGTGTYTITSKFTPTKFENDAEPNDSASVASTLPLNGNKTGHLGFFGNGKTDYDDWLKITTTSDGALFINTFSDSTLEIDNYIFDQDKKTQIASYDYGGAHLDDQTHVNNLAAGTYYIRTNRYGGGYGSYTIKSTFTASKLQNDTEPNDSVSVALVMAPNESKTGHLGYYTLGKTDYDDWWKITTTSDGALFINTLSDSTLEIDNYIFDQDKKTQIASYDYSGAHLDDQTHVSNLAAGTYYIRTYRYAGYGSYTIKSTFTRARYAVDQEPNNTRETALTIITAKNQYGHLGYYGTGNTDTADFSTFTVPAGWDSLFVRVLSDSTLEADVNLFNAKGDQILHNGENGVHTVMVYTKPPAGQYSLNIYRFNGYGAYAFIVTNTWQSAIKPDIGSIAGTIKNSSTGQGISATVSVSPGDYSAATKSSGSFVIDGIPAGSGYTVTASASGYKSSSTANVTIVSETTTTVNMNLSPVSQIIIFSDNFSDSTNTTGWEFIRGSWKETAGFMTQNDNYYDANYSYSGGVFALAGEKTLSDYTVSADIRSDDNDRMGLVFRFQDTANFYAFSWDRELGERAIIRVSNGTEKVLVSDKVVYEMGSWYHTEISVFGSRIQCSVNGVLLFDVTDTAIPNGKAGLYNNGNSGGYFDNFVVTGSGGGQIAPPANVKVADVPGDQGHRIKLTWTLSTSESDGSVSWYRILRSRSSTLTTPVSIKKFATIDSLNFWDKTTTVLIDSVAAGIKEYTDQGVPLNGVNYYYWLQAVGKTGVSKPVAAGFTTAVEDAAPLAFKVSDPWPNPFNPTVMIRYQIPEIAHVRIVVYDVLGRKVAVPVDGLMSAGVHKAVWNGRDDKGAVLGSGTYIWRLESGARSAQGKMLLLK